MSQLPRTRPLQADPGALAGDPVDDLAGDAPASDEVARHATGRSALLGVAVGLAVAVAGIAIAFSIIAIPLFIVASTEPGSGLDRDLVRTGLFKVALPFGLVAGLATGIAVGVWYGRGGRLPRDRTPLEL